MDAKIDRDGSYKSWLQTNIRTSISEEEERIPWAGPFGTGKAMCVAFTAALRNKTQQRSMMRSIDSNAYIATTGGVPDPTADDKDFIVSMVRQKIAVRAWVEAGRNSFFVSPELAEALDNTDLRGAPVDAVRLPYMAIWIESLPKLDLLETAQFCPRGVLVYQDEPMPNGTPVLTMACLYETPNVTGTSGQPATLYAWLLSSIEMTGESMEAAIRGSGERLDDHLNVWTDAGKGVAQGPIGRAAQGLSDDMAEVYRRVCCYVANFLLYLSAPNPDLVPVLPPQAIPKPGASKKAREAVEQIARRRGATFLVGSRFQAAPRPHQEGEGEAKWKNRRHLVRGHWHTYLVGEGRSRRTIRWVAPFWRGSGQTEGSERTYVAEA